MKRKYIPKYLNAEPQILWWDISEFVILLLFIAFGVLSDMPYIGAMLGVVALKIATKLKNYKQAGFMKHYAYGFGLYGMKNKVPEFWIKELGR